jgi:hypothetical protein
MGQSDDDRLCLRRGVAPRATLLTVPMEPQSSYLGRVAVWVDGAKRFEATARLTRYVDASTPSTFGLLDLRHGGLTSWDGFLEYLTDRQLSDLLGQQFELRGFPGGRVGEALLTGTDGRLTGNGEPPFG